MEREFLDVLDYELSVSEADILDLHETLIPSRSSQSSAQLHPFFHTSALESAPRPEGGVQMFRTRRVTDEAEDEADQEDGSISSGYLHVNELPTTPSLDEISLSDEETQSWTKSPVPSSLETSTSSGSSPGPSTAATSVFSYHPKMVSKSTSAEDDDVQLSAVSRALRLAGHQLVSSIPPVFPQIAASA